MMPTPRILGIVVAMLAALLITTGTQYWSNTHKASGKKSEGQVTITGPNFLAVILILLGGLTLVTVFVTLIILVVDAHISNHQITHFLRILQTQSSSLSTRQSFDLERQRRTVEGEGMQDGDTESNATESIEGTFRLDELETTAHPQPQPSVHPHLHRHYPTLGTPRQSEPVINLGWLHEMNTVAQPHPGVNQPTIAHMLRRTKRVADFTALRQTSLSNRFMLLPPSHAIFSSPHIILDQSSSSDSDNGSGEEEETVVECEMISMGSETDVSDD